MVHRTSENAEAVIGQARSSLRRTSHSYFVVMIDHGQRGLEAVVHPEDTRREIVKQLASGKRKHVVFIHHVDGLFIEDVTDELLELAEQIAFQAAE